MAGPSARELMAAWVPVTQVLAEATVAAAMGAPAAGVTAGAATKATLLSFTQTSRLGLPGTGDGVAWEAALALSARP
jgi:hypothetical protein